MALSRYGGTIVIRPQNSILENGVFRRYFHSTKPERSCHMLRLFNQKMVIKNPVISGILVFLTFFFLSTMVVAEENEFGDLPPGEGRELTFDICTECHSTKVMLQSRLTRYDWDETITDMEVEMREEQKMEEEAEEDLQDLMAELLEEALGSEDKEILQLLGGFEEERTTELSPKERAQILDYLSEALGPKPFEGGPFHLYRPMPLY